MLPLEIIVTIFTFLPGLKAIAVCASVSTLCRQAAGQAMPRRLDLGNPECPPYGSRGLARLFERPLGPVKVVKTHTSEGLNQKDSLFFRICCQASGLQDVTMRSEQFRAMGLVLPASLRVLDCQMGARELNLFGFDMAPLSRLMQLEELRMPHYRRFGDLLPQLPALKTLYGEMWSLEHLSPVAATLENLHISAHRKLDFSQLTRLADFTRLRRLHCCFRDYTPLMPDQPHMLPSTLSFLTLAWFNSGDANVNRYHDFALAFLDAGGRVAVDKSGGQVSLTWNRAAPV